MNDLGFKRIKRRLLALTLLLLTVQVISAVSFRDHFQQIFDAASFKAWLAQPMDPQFWTVTSLRIQVLLLAIATIVEFSFWRSIGRAQRDVKKLEESDWFANSTVNALTAQIAILDSSGCILSTNRSWKETETTGESIVAGHGEDTNYLATCDAMAGQGLESAAAIAGAIRAVTTGQSGQSCVEYSAQFNGEKRWYLCRVTRFPGNAKVRIVMAHEDITARKRAEELADAAKRAADAASQAKTAFLANMSHEIRTPMTAILGYGDLMLDPNQSPADRARSVQVIRRNGEHLLRLINDVLDISKIEANKYEVERVRSDLRQLLSDIVALTRVKAIQKGLNFKVIVDGQVPKEILTDPLRLKQILVNIVGNAIKFTSSGGVYMRVSCQDRIAGSTLHVDVIDTGIGMSGDQIGRLFRPFTQADESTTRKFGGTGLGLVISRRFAQLLGGDIAVQSEADIGTCFSVWIDAGNLGGVRMLPSLDESDLISQPARPVLKEYRFAGRVLLAEDGEDNQQLITHMLRNVGIDVVLAPNGLIAIEMANAQQFDVILMDMQMPELDGYSATRQLRQQGYTRPIVALTANAMADDRAKCLAVGCDDYASKPIKIEQLMSALGRFLRALDPEKPEAEASAPATDSIPQEMRLHSALADNEKYRSLLEKFVTRLPDRVTEMQRLLNDNDMQQLSRVVHQIKGAAGGYGFPDITVAAGRAEEVIKRVEDLDEIAEQVNQLVSLVQRVEGFPESAIKLAAGPKRMSSSVGDGVGEAAPTAHATPKTHVDAVSGLPNRTNLMERLSADVSQARQTAGELSCIAIKIDQLKAIEETHSRSAADALIKRVAAVLESYSSGRGEVYRADADYFVITLRDRAVADTDSIMESLGSAICAERFDDLIKDWKLTCIFGVAKLSIRTFSAIDLLKAATSMIESHRPAQPSALIAQKVED